MPHHRHLVWLFVALLSTGCAHLHDRQSASSRTVQHSTLSDSDLSPANLAALMSQTATLDSAAVPTEILRLEPTMEHGTVAERLQLAYLLSRENSGMDELYQAERILAGLIPTLKNRDTRELVRLLQRNIRLQLLLSEERDKVAELSRKIQQIKGLEKELQKHNLTDDSTGTTPSP